MFDWKQTLVVIIIASIGYTLGATFSAYVSPTVIDIINSFK